MKSTEARFWDKVQRGSECWLWTARVDRCGYGAFSLSRRTIVRAHRFSWELERGPVPARACLLHRCEQRRCVNPDHLYIGSAHEQIRQPRSRRPRLTPLGLGGRRKRHWTQRTPAKVRRGARSNLSKLCADEVREIRARWQEGAPVAELALQFDVVPETIVNIVRFRTWRDVGQAFA
jgi:hypothetical protein